MRRRLLPAALTALVVTALTTGSVAAQTPDLNTAPSAAEVDQAMRKAIAFFAGNASRHGGYVYYLDPKLEHPLGEGPATDDQIWVQVPGTPEVGLALLKAWRANGDPAALEAATAAAEALVYGQLESGGWTNLIDFDPASPRTGRYRGGRGRAKGRNFSSLDDGITQNALRFLVNVDEAHRFSHAPVHEAIGYAFDRLLAAQFPNGAFPQGWDRPVTSHPVAAAQFPEYDWRTENRIKEYWHLYTLNDGLAGSMADLLAEANRVYREARYEEALRRLGQFLIRARMPSPQPAWCQQYHFTMEPSWARPFEPPAIAGRESQDVIATLLRLSAWLDEPAFLEPLPESLAYLQASRLPDGRLARYYELRSNRPLYMERRGGAYHLSYDDSRLPSHYGWKVDAEIDRLSEALNRVRAGHENPFPPPDLETLASEATKALSTLDAQGRWLSLYQGEVLVGQPKFQPGEAFVSSETFSRRLTALADYLIATRSGSR